MPSVTYVQKEQVPTTGLKLCSARIFRKTMGYEFSYVLRAMPYVYFSVCFLVHDFVE